MSNPNTPDAAMLATLTDEEREAIADTPPDELDSHKAAPAEEADDAEGDDAADAADDGEDDEVEAVAAAAEALRGQAADVAEEAAPVAQAQDPQQPPPTPAFSFDKPEDFDARVTANKEATDALFSRFKEGEITAEELQAEQAKLIDERDELNAIRIKADIARDSQEQAMRAQHQAAVNALFATALQPSGGGVDYSKDEAKRADLDAFVRALAANEKNNDKPLAWFLNEAHTRVMALHGIARKQPSKADLVAAANARRKPDLTPTRQSLANIPGGEGSNPVGGEFDDVLALEGEAYEAAIEKMARSAPERFARFQGMTQ